MEIEQNLLERLVRLADEAAPRECCGILWSATGSTADRFSNYPGPLLVGRFRLDDEWLLKEHYEAFHQGRSWVGYYHSHPNGQLEPSRADLQGHPPGARFLLLSPGGNTRVFQSVSAEESPLEVRLRIKVKPADQIGLAGTFYR